MGPYYGRRMYARFCRLKERKRCIGPESGICGFQDREIDCAEFEALEGVDGEKKS